MILTTKPMQSLWKGFTSRKRTLSEIKGMGIQLEELKKRKQQQVNDIDVMLAELHKMTRETQNVNTETKE